MKKQRCNYELAVEKYFGLSDSVKQDDKIEVDYAALVDFAQSIAAQPTKKRFQVDCLDNQLFMFDENGKQLHQTDVTFCRMTFIGIVEKLQSEHQR